MKFTAPIATLLTVLSALHTASAAPIPAAEIKARQEYPEVIPGPGLPSLASLGLTTADLYNMGPVINRSPAAEADDLVSRENATCDLSSSGDFEQALACVNYIEFFGESAVVIEGNLSRKICSSGDAAIFITGNKGELIRQSTYKKVAGGLRNVLNDCRVNDRVSGRSAAVDNGDFLVSIQGNFD